MTSPLLSRSRPQRRAASQPDSPAGVILQERNRRVEGYRQLVRPIALHYARWTRESSDDLIQVGLLGLIRAAELYRPERSVPFAAFARPHIRGAMLHYLRDKAPCIRLPRRQAELQDKLSRLERCQLPGSGGSSPEQVCRQLGLTREQWVRLQEQRQLRRPCRLEPDQILHLASAPEPGIQEEGGEVPPVEAMLAILEPRQRLVVSRVVLAGWSYRRIGAEMKVSPMTVQRLLRRGLDRLRDHLDASGFSFGDRDDPAASAAPAC